MFKICGAFESSKNIPCNQIARQYKTNMFFSCFFVELWYLFIFFLDNKYRFKLFPFFHLDMYTMHCTTLIYGGCEIFKCALKLVT